MSQKKYLMSTELENADIYIYSPAKTSRYLAGMEKGGLYIYIYIYIEGIVVGIQIDLRLRTETEGGGGAGEEMGCL